MENRRETRFRAPQAENFSPAALKNRIFGLFLIILKIDFLRKPLFLRKPPLLVPNLEKGGFLNWNTPDAKSRPVHDVLGHG